MSLVGATLGETTSTTGEAPVPETGTGTSATGEASTGEVTVAVEGPSTAEGAEEGAPQVSGAPRAQAPPAS